MKPYGIAADLHFYNYSQFNKTFSDGTTERVRIVCDALLEMAEAVVKSGGDEIVLAGDIFHSRGKLSPTVVNPVKDTFEAVNRMGVSIIIIPGNHDLESEESIRTTSAVEYLRSSMVTVYSEPFVCKSTKRYYIPWINDIDSLKEALQSMEKDLRCLYDVFMHAPINGVIDGIPPTGLDFEWVLGLGYRNVFSGHYHSHVRVSDTYGERSVCSIGSLTHQSFKDCGTQSGFIIYEPMDGKYEIQKTSAPEFITMGHDEVAEQVGAFKEDDGAKPLSGNYLRVNTEGLSASEIKSLSDEIKQHLRPKGVTINNKPASKSLDREGNVVTGVFKIEEMIGKYATSKYNDEAVLDAALSVYAKAARA